MSDTQPEVPEMAQMLIDGFSISYKTLSKLFGTASSADVAAFSSVLATLRPLPADVQEQVAAPIIAGIFEALSADPTTAEGRAIALPFADNIAAALADATQIMLQNMRAQQAGPPSSLVMPKTPSLVV